MSGFGIYLKMIVIAIRAKMEYRLTFVFTFFALLVFYLGQLGVILIMLSRFRSIAGWAIGEMMFLYGLMVFSQGLTTVFFASLNDFESLIISGDFDRFLVRPLDPLTQILSSRFEITSVAHFFIGSTALYFGSIYAEVEWTLLKAMFFPLALSGAVLIQGGIRLAVSAVAFWTLRNRALVHTAVYSSKEMIYYPISIYKLWVQYFLTLLFPLAFVNFYPSHYFLNRSSSDLLFHPIIQFMTPVMGLVVFTAAYVFWKAGIRSYQSAGH